MRNAIKHLSGFSLTVVTNAAISLAVIPAIIHVSGSNAWASVAVGQAVGSIASVVLAMGWGYNGPTMIAKASADERQSIVRHSLIARSVLAPVVVAAACAISAAIAPISPGTAALGALPIAIGGLSLTWVFIGARDSTSLFIYDTAPRAVFALAGVAALLATSSLMAFLLLQIAGAVLAIVASTARSLDRPRSLRLGRKNIAESLSHLRQQFYASVTVLSASAYMSMPTLVVAGVGTPRALAIYALAERLGRFTLMALTPINQLVQGWVPSNQERIPERIRLAVKLAAVSAVLLGLSITFLGPLAAHVLSGGKIDVPMTVTAPLGLAIAASSMSRVVGMACLLALSKDRAVAASALIGAAVGVPALFILVPLAGAAGATSAVAISELSVVVFQSFVLKRAMTSSPDREPGAAPRATPSPAGAPES